MASFPFRRKKKNYARKTSPSTLSSKAMFDQGNNNVLRGHTHPAAKELLLSSKVLFWAPEEKKKKGWMKLEIPFSSNSSFCVVAEEKKRLGCWAVSLSQYTEYDKEMVHWVLYSSTLVTCNVRLYVHVRTKWW